MPLMYIQDAVSPALISSHNKQKLLVRLPGYIYKLLGDFLGEKLPLILFTNRVSFKISLSYQIQEYEQYGKQAQYQLLQL